MVSRNEGLPAADLGPVDRFPEVIPTKSDIDSGVTEFQIPGSDASIEVDLDYESQKEKVAYGILASLGSAAQTLRRLKSKAESSSPRDINEGPLKP